MEEIFSQIWDILTYVFGGLGRGIERGITSLFGSSNARYLKKLQPTIDAINALESKFQTMTDAELREQTVNSASVWRRAKPSKICWSRPLPFAARPAAAFWACATTTCS